MLTVYHIFNFFLAAQILDPSSFEMPENFNVAIKEYLTVGIQPPHWKLPNFSWCDAILPELQIISSHCPSILKSETVQKDRQLCKDIFYFSSMQWPKFLVIKIGINLV
jgi:hypothetical protein